ncbi:MAG: hypothetical protein GF418_09765, partial [Chitinivibrionales bacterium]|nr:hypothetical protein [Chitinivibrionales bacterium]MBD3395897.1 hypothetical protein [Chitinivibrionales bacterium]
MARMRRFEFSGGITHVMSRGIDGMPVFRDDDDRHAFLARLGSGLKRTGFKCYAWALMNTHYHLVLRTNEHRLSRLMRSLNGGYAIRYNRKYSRNGYLFQDRFKSVVCHDQEYARELVRYVHLNPLRATVVPNIEALKSWFWCGHRALLGDKRGCSWQNTSETLRRFGRFASEARKSYIAFLNAGLDIAASDPVNTTSGNIPSDSFPRKHQEFVLPGIVGDPDFVRAALKANRFDKIAQKRYLHQGWNLKRLEQFVTAAFSLEDATLATRGRLSPRSEARAAFAFLAHE